MTAISREHAPRRRRLRLRKTGWAIFLGGIALTTVLSTISPGMVLTPAVVGVIALVLTQVISWRLRRKQHSRRHDATSRSLHSSSARHTRAAASSAVIGDFSPARAQRAAERADRDESAGSATGRSRHRKRGALKRPLRAFVVIALALPIAAVVALWMGFEDRPLVVQRGELSMQTYEKAQQIAETLDPRTAGADGMRTMVASQDDVNLMLTLGAKRFHNASAHVEFMPGVALVKASVRVPASPFGPWLNFDGALRETKGLLTFDRLTVGSLPVPAFVADFALDQAIARFTATERGRIAKDMVKSVSLSDSQVRVVYEWRADLVSRARATLLTPEDQARFHAYSDRLFEVIDQGRRRSSVPLSQLLPPMFLLAKQRSLEGDGAQENRAAIITLAFFAFGRDLSAIIPAAASWRAPVPVEVLLYDRDDLAQHFLVSAALAAEGGTPLSNAIGVFREMDDSHRTGKGKGFSFHDLVADRAGTRFGTLAAKSPQKLQASLAPGIKDSDFMPSFAGLEEEIPAAEFKRRYGGVGSPTYNNVMADIEARVERTPLLR